MQMTCAHYWENVAAGACSPLHRYESQLALFILLEQHKYNVYLTFTEHKLFDVNRIGAACDVTLDCSRFWQQKATLMRVLNVSWWRLYEYKHIQYTRSVENMNDEGNFRRFQNQIDCVNAYVEGKDRSTSNEYRRTRTGWRQ